MAIFDPSPQQLENRSTDFDETWNLGLPPEDHQACKTTYRCVNVGGLGEHPVCHSKFLSLPFLISSSRAQVVPGDRSAPKLALSAVSAKEVPFGVSMMTITFRGSDPQNPKFGGRE